MKFSMEEYNQKLEIWRKNRLCVPLEVLKTKYAKGYRKLAADLKEMTNAMIFCMISANIIIFEEDICKGGSGEMVIDTISKIILDAKSEGIDNQISHAIFQEYDIEKAIRIITQKLCYPIWYQAYGPYWVSKCHTENEVTTCDIVPGFIWDSENCIWVRYINGEIMEFTTMLPPTMELIKKEEKNNEQKRKYKSI